MPVLTTSPRFAAATGGGITDSFTRADSATTMGTTETGSKTWTPNSGTWGITTNRAYIAAGGAQLTTIVDAALANCTVEVTIENFVDSGLCFRSTDDSNNLVTNGGNLFKRVAGSFTSLGSFTYGTGSVIKAVLNGSAIELFQDGVSELSVTEAFNSTATQHGLRVAALNTANRFDTFSVVA